MLGPPESHRSLDQLFEESDDAVFITDPREDRILDANAAASRLLGYTREEYLSLTIPALDPTMNDPMEWEANVTHLRTFGSRILEGLHRRKDGSIFPVEAHVSHIRLDREYLVAIVRDQRVIAPTPEEPLEPGDELLFVALPEAEAAIRHVVIR